MSDARPRLLSADAFTQPQAMAPDTIVAVSTPSGRGAIGIVRLSGTAAHRIACTITRSVDLAPRQAHYRAFHDDDGEAFDDGLVLYFPAPRTYTGEDLVEFHGHGNPVLLHRLVALACADGARAARPGEFTERAFLNDRLDLAQAEAVADLIASPTLRAARAAHRTLSGDFGDAVSGLVERVRLARAELEAAIDFGDDVDTDALLAHQGEHRAALCRDLTVLLARAQQGVRLHEGLQVAIVGAPNVGKSSLLNRLAGVERAIVTAVPGTTRDLVDVDLLIGSVPVRLVDTAGLRETDDVIEAEGIRRTQGAASAADLVLHVVDRLPATALPDTVTAIPRIVVRNKIDLASAHEEREVGDAATCVPLSALTGQGCDALIEAIERFAGIHGEDSGEFAARARHVAALEAALEALRGIDEAGLADAPELVAEHYRQASDALEAIAGRYGSEALLGDIFARFCIGK